VAHGSHDAHKLAEYLRAGLLTEVAPPTKAQEATRALVRQRNACVQDLGRARHQPPDVVALADRALRRQHALYWRLINRGKHRIATWR